MQTEMDMALHLMCFSLLLLHFTETGECFCKFNFNCIVNFSLIVNSIKHCNFRTVLNALCLLLAPHKIDSMLFQCMKLTADSILTEHKNNHKSTQSYS